MSLAPLCRDPLRSALLSSRLLSRRGALRYASPSRRPSAMRSDAGDKRTTRCSAIDRCGCTARDDPGTAWAHGCARLKDCSSQRMKQQAYSKTHSITSAI